MRANITVVDGCKVKILAFESDLLGKVSQKTIDLTPYAGQRARIWLEKDGTYSLDPKRDHFWQVAEVAVPGIAYKEVEAEDPETKETVMQSEVLPLDLSGIEIVLFDLPGTKNIDQPSAEVLNV